MRSSSRRARGDRLPLALCFAAGIGLLVVGPAWSSPALAGLGRPTSTGRSGVTVGVAGIGALVGWVLAWSLCHVPIVALATAAAGGYVPFALERRRRARADLERERAWPAALAQLADALEAGIAFPTAVTLVADAGPPPLRRPSPLSTDGSAPPGSRPRSTGSRPTSERTTDTVALLLRAGLLELPADGLGTCAARAVGRSRRPVRGPREGTDACLEPPGRGGDPRGEPVLLASAGGRGDTRIPRRLQDGGGNAVGALAGVMIFGCYLLMLRLGRVPEPRRTGAGK